MPSTKVTLAYAVEVPIATLGAHLEAYVTLLPTIETLRLCNRYGQGEKAVIAQLPVEVVCEIEWYLMEDERQRQRKAWSKDFKCWEGKCMPIDHMSEEKILQTYNEVLQDEDDVFYHDDDDDDATGGGSGGEDHHPRRRASRCDSHVRESIADLLETWWDDEGHDSDWSNAHEQSVNSWFGRVGHHAAPDRGQFDGFLDALEQHFGLHAWVSHTPDSTESRSKYMSYLITGSTAAYLYIPESFSAKHEWERIVERPDFDAKKIPTEAGSSYDVRMPSVPSKKSMRRFSRALEILTMVQTTTKKDKEKLKLEGKSNQDLTEELTWVRPKLKMLIHDVEENEGY